MLFLDFTAYNSPDLCKTNTGLGNILFQLSSQYSISKKYNIEANYFYLNKFLEKIKNYDLDCYNKTIFRNFYLDKKNHNITHIFKETKKAHIYDNNLIENILKYKNENILINNSYLQSLKYYNNFKSELLDIFSPDEESYEYILNKYDIFKNKNIIKVSLHLRLLWGGNIKYSSQYYIDSINFIKNKLNIIDNNIKFLVFSDNISEAKIILNNITEDFIYFEHNKDYIDLWSMSLCDHNIICHSTLSWWGAYLNKNLNRLVLYPSDIINFYSKLCNIEPILLEKNYIPNDWISINSSSLIY